MRLLITLTLFAHLFFYTIQINAAQTQKLILATGDWEPYVSQHDPQKNKFTDVIATVFKEMGIEVEYIFAPWKRVETIVKEGKAFAAFPYAFTEERNKIFDYSVPVMASINVFFYRKKDYPNGIHYTNLDELAPYHIGAVRGYWYEELFNKTKLNVEYVTTDEQGIVKLHFGRIDLAASDDLVGWNFIKKLYPNEQDEFAVIEKDFGSKPLHLMVSKNYPHAKAITQQFNETFKRLSRKGLFPAP